MRIHNIRKEVKILNIYGWILLVIAVIAILTNILNDKLTSGTRLVDVLWHFAFGLYVYITMFK